MTKREAASAFQLLLLSNGAQIDPCADEIPELYGHDEPKNIFRRSDNDAG